jgi:triosephosphate isomerase (TIM)
MRALIAGNWKMHGLAASRREVAALADKMKASAPADCDVLICPPATLVAAFAKDFSGTAIHFGGQDCHPEPGGAHTGDISSEMYADIGAAFVIVGHSERRADHNESDAEVRSKAEAVLRAGLTPIVCVGESEAERKAGKALDIVGAQLERSLPETSADFVIAYEPVWAIGTGLTPTLADIAEMHDFIREKTRSDVRILYGGSVKPSNAAEILAIDNVNGALVGGASLKTDDFYPIVMAGGKQ